MEYSAVHSGLTSLDELHEVIPDTLNMRRLMLHGNQIEQLGNTLDLPNLEYLNISSNQLDELDGAHVCNFSNLATLDAAANSIRRVRRLGLLKQLSVLNLSFNSVSDLAFLTQEVQAGEHDGYCLAAKLMRLDFRDNAVATLGDLAPLRHCTHLLELRMQSVNWRGPTLHCSEQNPVCHDPAYVTTVLAYCPSLRVLDDVSVSDWKLRAVQYTEIMGARQPSAAQPSAATPPRIGSASALAVQGEAQHARVNPPPSEPFHEDTVTVQANTPHLDEAEKRFVGRLVSRLGGKVVYGGEPVAGDALQSVRLQATPSESGPMTAKAQTMADPSHEQSTLSATAVTQAVLLALKNDKHMDALEATVGSLQHVANQLSQSMGARENATQTPPVAPSEVIEEVLAAAANLQEAHIEVESLPAGVLVGNSSLTALAHLRIENTNLRGQLASMVIEHDKLKAQLEGALAQAGLSDSRASALEATNTREIQLREKLVEEFTKQVDGLLLQLKDKSLAHDVLRAELAGRPTEESFECVIQRASELEKRLLTAPTPERLAALQAHALALSEENSKLQAEVEEANRSFIGVRKSLEHAEDAMQRLGIELQEVKTERHNLHFRNTSLQASLDQAVAIKARLEEATRLSQEQLSATLQEIMNRARDAESERDRLSKLVLECQAREARAQEKYSTVEDKLRSAHENLAEMSVQRDSSYQQERQRSQTAIAALESQLQSVKLAAEQEIRRAAEDAGAKLRHLSSTLTAITEKHRSLLAEHNRLTEDRDQLSCELRKCKVVILEKEERIRAMAQDLQEAENHSLSALSTARAVTAERVSEAASALTAAQLELSTLQTDLAGQREAAHKLSVSIAQLQNEIKVKDTMLNDQNDTIRLMKRAASTQREESESAEAAWKEANTELKHQLQEISQRCEALFVARDEALAECEKAEAAAHTSRRFASQMEQLLNNVRAEAGAADSLRRELSAKEAALTFVDREIAQIKAAYDQKIATTLAERDDLQLTTTNLREKISRLQDESAVSRDTIAEQRAQLDAMTTVSRQREADAQALRARVAAVEAEMKVLLQQLDTYKSRNKDQLQKMAGWLMLMQSDGVLPDPVDSPARAAKLRP